MKKKIRVRIDLECGACGALFHRGEVPTDPGSSASTDMPKARGRSVVSEGSERRGSVGPLRAGHEEDAKGSEHSGLQPNPEGSEHLGPGGPPHRGPQPNPEGSEHRGPGGPPHSGPQVNPKGSEHLGPAGPLRFCACCGAAYERYCILCRRKVGMYFEEWWPEDDECVRTYTSARRCPTCNADLEGGPRDGPLNGSAYEH
ncbi:MAG: hypothetical protein ABII00_12880 [Elusimicrobiota bacterium]